MEELFLSSSASPYQFLWRGANDWISPLGRSTKAFRRFPRTAALISLSDFPLSWMRERLWWRTMSLHKNKIKLSRCGQDVTSIQQRSDGVQERLCVCVCVSQDCHELYLHFVERQIRLKAQKLNTQKKKVTNETCQELIRLIFHLKIFKRIKHIDHPTHTPILMTIKDKLHIFNLYIPRKNKERKTSGIITKNGNMCGMCLVVMKKCYNGKKKKYIS